MTNLKKTRQTTRRGFVKGSLATGFAAGIAAFGSGSGMGSALAATGSAPTGGKPAGGTSIVGRMDQPLNQMNHFDSAEHFTTAWASQVEKTGQLRL